MEDNRPYEKEGRGCGAFAMALMGSAIFGLIGAAIAGLPGNLVGIGLALWAARQYYRGAGEPTLGSSEDRAAYRERKGLPPKAESVTKENKHFTQFKAAHLLSNERVLAHVAAYRKDVEFEGVAVLTDKRLVFFREGTLSAKFEPLPLSKVSSVEGQKGLLNYKFKARTSGDSLEILVVGENSNAEAFVRAVQEAIHTPEPTIAHLNSDPVEQLRKLGELRDSGILSEEEFLEKKAVVLGTF